jgi:hypothetical protein
MESETPSGLRGRILHPSYVLFQIIATILVAGALTLARVHDDITPPPVSENPTPLGYTWSLLLFLLPLAYLAFWFFLHPSLKIPKKAFGITMAILAPLGILLDLLFAHTFFVFENTGAVCGIEIPGVGGGIPIEEFVFYVSGFFFVLLLYIWSDEAWLERYNLPHDHDDFKSSGPVLSFHVGSVVTAAVLLGLAVLYKKFFAAAADAEGFPWYWTYLLAASFIPSAGFYRTTRRFINWRAFSFTFFLVMLISLMWEASLASPYLWWGYKHDTMMGIFITAWNYLPLEAVFVWLVVTFTTVILYEVITIWQVSGKKLSEVLFGS